MNLQEKVAARTAPDRRGISQLIFVLVGIGIISGGLWSLYMADAPYHPQDDVILASD